MRLTAHFVLSEFGVDIPPDVVPRIRAGCYMLETLRGLAARDLGKVLPIKITSGYRSDSPRRPSTHGNGEAYDFRLNDGVDYDRAKALQVYVADRFSQTPWLTFDQLIVYEHTVHCHLGITLDKQPRRQVLACWKDDEGEHYTPWSSYTGPLKQIANPATGGIS